MILHVVDSPLLKYPIVQTDGRISGVGRRPAPTVSETLLQSYRVLRAETVAQRRGATIVGDCGVVVVQQLLGAPAIVVGFREIAVERDRAIVRIDRLALLAHPMVGVAEHVPVVRVRIRSGDLDAA